MATKTIFTLDGSTITAGFKSLISKVKKMRLNIVSKEGKNLVNMPLILAVIVGIILPVLTVVAVILILVLSYKVAVEYDKKTDIIVIDKL